MSRGLNRIQLIGHLGRDAEMRYTPSGAPVTEFSLAVNRRRRGQDGQWIEETDWFRVICWNRLAEFADQYLKRGMRVYVDGRLQIRRFTGNDGVERTAVEVIANDIIMLSARPEEPPGPETPEPDESELPKELSGEDEFDDVPF
uniref:Single-stranded DNA-binding protein n=2 Tax=Thermorudis TaxID=1649508 RepID=A0A831THQ3_9BACT